MSGTRRLPKTHHRRLFIAGGALLALLLAFGVLLASPVLSWDGDSWQVDTASPAYQAGWTAGAAAAESTVGYVVSEHKAHKLCLGAAMDNGVYGERAFQMAAGCTDAVMAAQS